MEKNNMPKMKTRKSAAKRFRITGTGKVVRRKAFGYHLMTKKSSKRKRSLKKSSLVSKTNLQDIKRIIYH
jgi:large subunit ribosomal protein L35